MLLVLRSQKELEFNTMRFGSWPWPRRALVLGALALTATGLIWWTLADSGRKQAARVPAPPAAAVTQAETAAALAPAAGSPAAGRLTAADPSPARETPEQAEALLPGTPPPWLAYAAPFPADLDRAVVAIVVDDLGLDAASAERAIRLPGEVTLSWLPYGNDLLRLTAAARAHGHELLVHVPMEPLAGDQDPGPDALLAAQSAAEIRRRLARNLSRFSGFVGINNHMGSRFTSDATAMMPVVDELKERGLLFLDSRTTGSSIAAELTRLAQVPTAVRDVYIDHDPDRAAIRARLGETEAIARKRGYAVAIGHPRDTTFAELEPWLAALSGRGLMLAPLSAIVRRDEERRIAHRP